MHSPRTLSLRFRSFFILTAICYAWMPHETPAAEERAVAPAVATTPEVFVQLGHSSGWLTSVAVSPDSRFVLTGASDKSAKLWDLTSGREIRTFEGHSGEINAVAFSPDGRMILATSGGASVLWDIGTGKVLRAYPGKPVFSRDGKSLLNVMKPNPTGECFVEATDIATDEARRLGTLAGWNFPAPPSIIAYSSDMSRLAAIGKTKDDAWELAIWDVASGEKKSSVRDPFEYFWQVAFSPDLKYYMTGSNVASLKLRNTATGEIVHTFADSQSLAVLVGAKNSASTLFVAFSPDGKTAVSSDNGNAVRLWDVTTGEEIRRGPFPANVAPRDGASKVGIFSPNGRYLLAASNYAKGVAVWEVATGRMVADLKGDTGLTAPSLAFTADGIQVISGNPLEPGRGLTRRPTVSLWETGSARGPRQLGENVGHINLVASVLGGSSILTRYMTADSSHHDVWTIFDAKSGDVVRSWETRYGSGSAPVVSADGRVVSVDHIGSSWGATIVQQTLWDMATGSEIRTEDRMQGRAFSPDGRLAYSERIPSGHVIWDVASGADVMKLDFRGTNAMGAFSPNGKLLAIGASVPLKNAEGKVNVYPSVALFDVASGQRRWRSEGHGVSVSSIGFSPDGTKVLTGGGDGTARLWDAADGKDLAVFAGHTGTVKRVGFADSGKRVLTAGNDNTVRIWDTASGKQIAQMNYLTKDEWVLSTPEGYFTASSPRAAESLNIRQGMSAYGIDQFYDVFYRPDIVEAALAGKDTKSLVTLTIDEAIKHPPPRIEKLEAPDPGAANAVKVSYRIQSAGGGIGEVRVFHNGKLVQSDGAIRKLPDAMIEKRAAADQTSDALATQMRNLAVMATKDGAFKPVTVAPPKPNLYEASVEIEPIPGENEVSVIAFNAQNSVQSRAYTMTFKSAKAPVPPRLHILAIGIDRYLDKSATLAFAVKDSKDVAAQWRAQAASIYGAENIFVETLANDEATRAGILARIEKIAATVRPTDHFLLFVAGHGVLIGDQYYMVTADYDGSLAPAKLISSNEIVDLSKRVKALSQLYILDTCHAGGLNRAITGLYDARMSVLAKKMGLHVFASASSVQQALDGFQGNGLFTHTLLSGLNNNRQADANNDAQVSLKELGTFSKGRTAELAKSVQHRQEPLIINFGQDAPIYRLR